MRRRRVGLRLRLLASLVLTSLLATVLVGATVLVLRRNALLADATAQATRQIEADLLEAGDLANRLGTHVTDPETGATHRVLPESSLDLLGRRLAELADVPFLVWQPGDADAYVSTLYQQLPRPPELADIVEQGLVGRMRLRIDDRPVLAIGGRIARDGLHVYRFVDLGAIEDELAALGRTVALAGTVPLALGLVLGLLASTGLVRPLRRARDAARRIGAGDLDVRLPVVGNDELAALSRSFNDMAASLQGTIDELVEMEARQRRFVADVSHELRTPLTALVAAVEVLEDELGDVVVAPDRREATLLAVAEVRAMRELVEDLMEITRFDAGRADLRESEVDLEGAVRATLARRGWRDVEVSVPGHLRVLVDPRRLDTIVANLVGNARRHGRAPVSIHGTAVGDDVTIEVADDGDGVPDDLRERVFERFAKGDEARSRTGGSGLGLAIARENARLHGGDLVLAEDDRPGARFRLTLPGRLLALVVVAVLAGGCRVDAAEPVVLGGAPDTSASALAERRVGLAAPDQPERAETADDVDRELPAGDSGIGTDTDLLASDTVPVLLFRGDEAVWVPRAAEEPAPDAVHAALAVLTEPLSAVETELGLTTAVELGTTAAGWNRRGDWLELRVEGAAYSGGTTTALRHRALQLACTAAAALEPSPVGINFVLGAPLDGVSVSDCPPLPSPHSTSQTK